jgi:hypothetical protein
VAIEKLPGPLRSPSVPRAATSPGALVGVGAGILVGLLVSFPIWAIVVLAVAGWAMGSGISFARARRRRRPAKATRKDPYSLPQPWRQFVLDANDARTQLEQALSRWPPGPLLDRLSTVDARLGAGIDEVWQVANQGAATAALAARSDPSRISKQLQAVQAERAALIQAGHEPRRLGELDRSEAALAATLASARRLQSAAGAAQDRLRSLAAQLDGAVASVVEISLQLGDPNRAEDLSGTIDSLVAEVDSLRQALQEGSATPTDASPVADPPEGT